MSTTRRRKANGTTKIPLARKVSTAADNWDHEHDPGVPLSKGASLLVDYSSVRVQGQRNAASEFFTGPRNGLGWLLLVRGYPLFLCYLIHCVPRNVLVYEQLLLMNSRIGTPTCCSPFWHLLASRLRVDILPNALHCPPIPAFLPLIHPISSAKASTSSAQPMGPPSAGHHHRISTQQLGICIQSSVHTIDRISVGRCGHLSLLILHSYSFHFGSCRTGRVNVNGLLCPKANIHTPADSQFLSTHLICIH